MNKVTFVKWLGEYLEDQPAESLGEARRILKTSSSDDEVIKLLRNVLTDSNIVRALAVVVEDSVVAEEVEPAITRKSRKFSFNDQQ